MVFLLKKLLPPFFMPLSLVLLLTIPGLFLLYFSKKQKIAKFMLTIGILVLTAFSTEKIPNMLLKPLETMYPPYNVSNVPIERDSDIKYVVVLSGGHISDPEIPATSQLSESTLTRLAEGIRIYRNIQGSKLLLSGGKVFDPIPEALTMANVANSLGIPKNDIIIESSSKDTKDQAKLIKKIVTDQTFILVTSAFHMPRSMALFGKLGMKPIPAPTQHMNPKRASFQIGSFLPNSGSLEKSEKSIHEHLGILWAKLRNQI